MVSPRLVALRATTALLATSLLLAGCSGGDDEGQKSSTDPDAQATSGGSTLDATWPLTGLPVKGGADAAQRHPVMVLKLDNTEASAPQQGLSGADLVVEELVEGGLTRLAAFFYTRIPDEVVGPVRSMRASDIGIVSPVDGAMVTSGAAAVTIGRLNKAGITYFSDGSKGFFRDGGRTAPYNLMTNLKETASAATQKAARPADYLPWGDEGDFPKGRPASGISAKFSAGHTTNWAFRDGGYVNENTYAAEGDEFPADTVLVLRVQVGDAGYTDPAGNPVPETKLEGKGPAMLFHDGRVVRGTWAKKGLDSAISLSTKAGELTVPAGHTWIELVPADDGDVVVTK